MPTLNGVSVGCGCFFCETGKPHRDGHTNAWTEMARTTVADSLDPRDRIYWDACHVCGHKRFKPNPHRLDV